MTKLLFRQDAYLKRAEGIVTARLDDSGIILDQCLFYPHSGGQPGDNGVLEWSGGSVTISNTVKGDGDTVVLIPAGPDDLPPVGSPVVQVLDWDRRHRHMRVHTALHLLSVVIPLPVTGGSISAKKGRLDFLMPEPPGDKEALAASLNALIEQDLVISESWICEDLLKANPGLVKTMSVKPPVGQGRIRLIRIGTDDRQIDLQPCGGTHVARSSEIGKVMIGKVENKGRQNRRVNLLIDPG